LEERKVFYLSDIVDFIKEKSGLENIAPSTDIYGELGFYGDDFLELIIEFSSRFYVDISSYLWSYHTSSEGEAIGDVLQDKTDVKLIQRIKINPLMLLDYANKGFWDFKYPNKVLMKKY
jgi:hypothetical protein